MTDFKELVYRGVESDLLDYKAPVDWNLLSKQQKAKFVRHALAFANTRGGSIVIGVREDASGRPALYEGLNDEQCHSFDPSTVSTYINSHVDPAIDITVERPVIDGKVYAILQIKPFSDIPHVALHSVDEEVQNGVFYIRTASASSRAASRAGEMHDLIRRALRNQKELLANLLREVLGEQDSPAASSTPAPQEIFPPEYDESVNFFSKRINSAYPENTPVMDIAVMPENSRGGFNIPLAELRKSCLTALDNVKNGKLLLDNADMQASYATNVSLRGINKNRDRFWQLFQNGLMHFRVVLPHKLNYNDLAIQLAGFFDLANAVYSQKIFSADKLQCQLTIFNSLDMQLLVPGASPESPAVCRIDHIKINAIADPADSSGEFTRQLMNELSVRFNAPTEND